MPVEVGGQAGGQASAVGDFEGDGGGFGDDEVATDLAQEGDFAVDEGLGVGGAPAMAGEGGGDVDGQPVALHQAGVDLARMQRKGAGGQAVEEPGGTVADDVAEGAARDQRLGEEAGADGVAEAVVGGVDGDGGFHGFI